MSPIEIYDLHPLFEDVQMKPVFPDGKTFVDCLPRYPLPEILQKYSDQKGRQGFDLKKFVITHFELPVSPSTGYQSDLSKTVEQNIGILWDTLTHQPAQKAGSLIPLPYPYIVPGGRFGEIYYWDSYFTMLGLKISGKTNMLTNMVNNFSYLLDTVGHIPNGSRSYFLSRSQPPFYSLMVRILAGVEGESVLQRYLPQLEKEYLFWMKGSGELKEPGSAQHRSVKMPGNEIMNRYWDENETPRPESYREDTELSHQSQQNAKQLFRHLRAGAESGWDFSSRWFKNEDSFVTIHTTEIIPVDLNCLIWHLERTIADAYASQGNKEKAGTYYSLAEKRKKAIQNYCWNEKEGFYFDYDIIDNKQKKGFTLAGMFPLFFELATVEQAKRATLVIQEKFLCRGGVVTTLKTTVQQWDAPNGWAPLHWITIMGLENYDHHELATIIAQRWIKLNTDVFKRTGKLMEKYNVVDTHLEAGGGEYEGQDGFGWTNGVLLALIQKYGAAQ